MKVFAGLVAATYATLTADDCPNTSWELNGDASACVPVSSAVTVTCSATGMNVVFDENLLYVSLDSSKSGTADSTANTADDSCTAATSTGGEYDINIPLDGCGTTVTQTGGEITFSNTIVGNIAAVTIDGIVTTETLELDVECVFDEKFSLTVDDIAVEAAAHTVDGSDGTGDFDTEFSLTSYTDSSYSDVSTTSNAVVIGKPVYNRVTATNLPTNVKFFVTDCTAQDARTSPTAEYDVIKDGCLDNLLDTTASTLGGDSSSVDVDFSFNGFTFASTSDIVYLTCDIVLCAIDTSDNSLIDASCGADKIDGACTDASSTLGYTAP